MRYLSGTIRRTHLKHEIWNLPQPTCPIVWLISRILDYCKVFAAYKYIFCVFYFCFLAGWLHIKVPSLIVVAIILFVSFHNAQCSCPVLQPKQDRQEKINPIWVIRLQNHGPLNCHDHWLMWLSIGIYRCIIG